MPVEVSPAKLHRWMISLIARRDHPATGENECEVCRLKIRHLVAEYPDVFREGVKELNTERIDVKFYEVEELSLDREDLVKRFCRTVPPRAREMVAIWLMMGVSPVADALVHNGYNLRFNEDGVWYSTDSYLKGWPVFVENFPTHQLGVGVRVFNDFIAFLERVMSEIPQTLPINTEISLSNLLMKLAPQDLVLLIGETQRKVELFSTELERRGINAKTLPENVV